MFGLNHFEETLVGLSNCASGCAAFDDEDESYDRAGARKWMQVSGTKTAAPFMRRQATYVTFDTLLEYERAAEVPDEHHSSGNSPN